MREYSLEEHLDESLLVKRGITMRDRVLIIPEARMLEHLYETHRTSASVEKQSKIRESASKLFKALTQLTVCGPEIRVLEAMVVDEQVEEKDNDRAQRQDQEQNIDIEQEDMKLIAEAEQLLSRQVAIAEFDHKAVGYILPYRHTGVWHCMFRSSDLILVISVTASRKMKVADQL
jgi:hypothetical protein